MAGEADGFPRSDLAAPVGEPERCGPLLAQRYVKDDGRALILFRSAPDASAEEAEVLVEAPDATAEPSRSLGEDQAGGGR